MSKNDFPMDQISILRKAGGHGDDILGIPEDKLSILHQAVMDGKTVLLMHCGDDDPQMWRQRLAWKGAEPVLTMP